MKFIKKLGVTCATVALMVSSASYAGTVSSAKLYDNYIGNSYGDYSRTDYMPNNSSAHYDTNWMTVDKSAQGILTVQIDSNFIGYDSVFKLGDLFLMDGNNYQTADTCAGRTGRAGFRGCNEDSYDKETNMWEYAFDLGLNLDSYSTKNSESNYNNMSGTLRKINTSANDVSAVGGKYHDDVYTSSQLKTENSGVRGWQIVDVKGSAKDVGVFGNNDSWSTDVKKQLLTMTFDISGTALMNTNQIALRWAMSCANDIIEVVANVKSGKSNPVPEPSTIVLMLLAGFGLFTARKNTGKKTAVL